MQNLIIPLVLGISLGALVAISATETGRRPVQITALADETALPDRHMRMPAIDAAKGAR